MISLAIHYNNYFILLINLIFNQALNALEQFGDLSMKDHWSIELFPLQHGLYHTTKDSSRLIQLEV